MGACIFLACDSRFEASAAVTIASIVRTNNAYPLYILDCGITAIGKTRIDSLVHVDFIDIKNSLNEIREYGKLSKAAAGRIFWDEFLPPEIDRALYLDSDTLVLAQLADLLTADMCGYAVAAVRDIRYRCLNEDQSIPSVNLQKAGKDLYFNSGVMLLDRRAWRKANIQKKVFDLLSQHAFQCVDQTALNIVLAPGNGGGGWMPLSSIWNVQTHHGIVESPRILHFTESPKPWSKPCSNLYRNLWLELYREIM